MCLIVMKIVSHNLIEIFKDMIRKHGLLNWQSMKHFIVIIYSPSCRRSKHVWLTDFCETQKKVSWRILVTK